MKKLLGVLAFAAGCDPCIPQDDQAAAMENNPNILKICRRDIAVAEKLLKETMGQTNVSRSAEIDAIFNSVNCACLNAITTVDGCRKVDVQTLKNELTARRAELDPSCLIYGDDKMRMDKAHSLNVAPEVQAIFNAALKNRATLLDTVCNGGKTYCGNNE